MDQRQSHGLIVVFLLRVVFAYFYSIFACHEKYELIKDFVNSIFFLVLSTYFCYYFFKTVKDVKTKIFSRVLIVILVLLELGYFCSHLSYLFDFNVENVKSAVFLIIFIIGLIVYIKWNPRHKESA